MGFEPVSADFGCEGSGRSPAPIEDGETVSNTDTAARELSYSVIAFARWRR